MVFKPALAILCLMFCAMPVARAGPIHDAAKAGDIEQLEQLLAQGADINQGGLATPLYYAINTEP